jgi:DNA-binding response OmpR family regulator
MHMTHNADENDVCNRRPRVLICEDDPILACDLEQQLEDLGFDPIGPFATQAEALRALRAIRPAAAVIDVELADGACTKLAGVLRDNGVPTVVVTGLRVSSPPPEFSDATWLMKPLPYDALARQFDGLIASQNRGEPANERLSMASKSQLRAIVG